MKTTKTTKTAKTVTVNAFGVEIDAIFAPIAANIKPNAHGAFVMLIAMSYPKPVTMGDLIKWQMDFAPDKYPASNATSAKRARGNVAAHIQNANQKSKNCNFADCGLRLTKTIDGMKLIPIE